MRSCCTKNGRALQYVQKAVQLAHPHMCLAAVQQNGMALRYVPESLKTNVEALAKLYTTSEEQLRSDLRLLQINNDVINQVICYLKAPIAKSSRTIMKPLGPGNDSEQPAENPVESREIVPEPGVLSMIEEHVHTPSNQENDEKESKCFTP